MILEWGQVEAHLLFVEQALRVKFDRKNVTWLSSVTADGEVLGVVVYSRFSAHNCEMSVVAASPRFLSRKLLQAFFGYPFNQLQCSRVTAVVETTNPHSYNFNCRLGFRVEGCLRKWFGHCDGIIMGMLKEECKWLGSSAPTA